MIVTTFTCPHCRSTLDVIAPGGWCPSCDLPVLLGHGDGPYLDVWCPHCEHDHHHGRHDPGTGCRFDGMRPDDHRCTCPPGTGDGHRAAHCHTEQSPYWDTGYIAIEYR
jgi:hypothetical protein